MLNCTRVRKQVLFPPKGQKQTRINLYKTCFHRCIENYTGARCEEVLLPNIKTQATVDLFAAFLASVVLLGVLVIGTFYFFCRKAHVPRTSSTECGASLTETTSSNGCNKITE
uniref:Uncharacterized protein n=1 Tax=Crocodylus porosus TaxID=8502 RepID=A0A7M4ELR6_CROPO